VNSWRTTPVAPRAIRIRVPSRSISVDEQHRADRGDEGADAGQSRRLALGSVNMVSKSAFERKNAQFRYNVGLAANSENFTLRREPHTNDDRIHKMRPSANFDLTLPLTPNFGFGDDRRPVGSLRQAALLLQHVHGGGGGHGGISGPALLSTYRLLDSPRTLKRQSVGLKADWRITRNSVLSAGGQVGHFVSDRIATEFSIQTGTNPARPSRRAALQFRR